MKLLLFKVHISTYKFEIACLSENYLDLSTDDDRKSDILKLMLTKPPTARERVAAIITKRNCYTVLKKINQL